MTEILKLPEVARRLGVSEKTARRYVKAGDLPSVFVGNAYRVSEEDVERYLHQARVPVGGEAPKAQAPPPPNDGGWGRLTPYEELGRDLASQWREQWEDLQGSRSNLTIYLARVLTLAMEIYKTKGAYELRGEGEYSGHPEFRDTLELMEEAFAPVKTEAAEYVRQLRASAKARGANEKTEEEFRKIWNANDLDALLREEESRLP